MSRPSSCCGGGGMRRAAVIGSVLADREVSARCLLRCGTGGGVGGQDDRRPGWLGEIEVVAEVAELCGRLSYVGSRVGSCVGGRVESLTAEEGVLDELGVGVVAQCLVVDVSLLGVGADDDARDAQAVAVLVDRRGRDVVVESSPVVPAEKDRRR